MPLNPVHAEIKTLAWVESKGRTYFTRSPELPEIAPTSAVIKLIQGIHGLYPRDSLRILRNLIFTNTPSNPLDAAVIKIAAKRWRPSSSFPSVDKCSDWIEILSIDRPFALAPLRLPEPNPFLIGLRGLNGQQILNLAETISHLDLDKPSHRLDRPVGAILISRDQELLAWGRNTFQINRTGHAEIHLAQSFYQKYQTTFPAGSILYTTLSPCRMCAAMIERLLPKGQDFKVIYRDLDSGKWAGDQLLKGLMFRASASD